MTEDITKKRMKLMVSGGRFYCVTPNRLYKGLKSKTFKDIDDLLQYAMGLNNQYVTSISNSIFKYIKETKHPILTKKNFSFC